MSWLLAFAAMFASDFAWARYVGSVKAATPLAASNWAVALFLLGAVAILSYVRNRWLLIPAALGAWAGTYSGVIFNG